MKTIQLYDEGHQWFAFARDPEKPEKIIDTNQYMVIHRERVLLMDPGGIEIFAPMLGSILHHTKIENITDLFASHQDPDIISSLGLWDQTLPKARLHSPWLWEGFIRHFGMDNIEYVSIPDQGSSLDLDGVELQFIPAHYLHSSGNFHVYDPVSKIMMCGDVGAALEPPEADMYVENFDEHIPKMEMFHKRWMPSNRAKNDWIARVRDLDIEMLCPQHGRIFKGENINKFLDWFEQLEVGVAVPK